MSNLPLYLLTFLAYGVLAVYFLRAQASGKGDTLSRGPVGHAVLLPLVLHGYLLHGTLFMAGEMNLSLVYVLSLILWLTMLVYWVARFFYPIASLQALVLPLVAVGSVLPALFPAVHTLSNTSFAFDAHIMAAMLVYSLFTIAALHAGLMSLVEKSLHHATLPRILRTLPPLLTMETLLFRIVGAGLVLLTFTLLSGVVFSEEVFGKPWQINNHKFVFGVIAWCVFAALLTGHHFYGWRGRKAVHWMMSGYVFLLLAYLGTKFVMEVLLHR